MSDFGTWCANNTKLIRLMLADIITQRDIDEKKLPPPYKWMRPMLDIQRENHAMWGNGPSVTHKAGTLEEALQLMEQGVRMEDIKCNKGVLEQYMQLDEAAW